MTPCVSTSVHLPQSWNMLRYDVDIRAAEAGKFRAVIQRSSRISMASSASPGPRRCPQFARLQRPSGRMCFGLCRPSSTTAWSPSNQPAAPVPVLLIVLAVVAAVLLLVYPWQQ